MQTRLATNNDLLDLFRWRNDAQTREMSFSQELLTMAEHEAWFRRSLANEDRVIVIGIEEGRKVGMVRYDRQEQKALVSINLNPDFRGRRLSHRLLSASEALIPADWGIDILDAEVRKENIASMKAFENAGYLHAGEVEVGASISALYRKSVEENDV